MRLRTRMTSRVIDAATTGAAYSLIGAEVVRRNVTVENARKVLAATRDIAISTGRLAAHTGRNVRQAAINARSAVHQRKLEIQKQGSDQNLLV